MSVDGWTIAELLPHTGRAILLDAVLAGDDTRLTALVTIGPGTEFLGSRGVPAFVGIEYMAQACGAFSGFTARRAGTPPRLGFILGTRDYRATRPWFAVGARFVVSVELIYRDDEIGVFDCMIHHETEMIAQARLTVAEPRDVASLIARRNATDAR